ncbi:MAG TPA: hypothetical protein DDY14_02755 [Chromatiaceae bacterium]|jgi:HPt (histidine-containing phosphotransfer) domain-containing protein|nr:MAG: hypothetical protein N838_10795 [Thiohalocapsa sp. PB-PSB1]QQO55782.1 MAG: Hpt domain-containing protein [Thiohalocapsa sp. PB-PSB1]HBG94247.1 hypothetical protein [Chromatiaceae bacterium]HCS89305.1 hypothetical protein [Chromatiaceae bacterium]
MEKPPLINCAAGLAMSGNDMQLYQRMLQTFHTIHGQDDAALRRCIVEQDAAAAQAIAHSLKGIVALLGAGALQPAAERVMRVCADDEQTDVEAWKPAVESLARELMPLLAELEQLIKDHRGEANMNTANEYLTDSNF